MNRITAYRPGPTHRFYKHVDYGTSNGWQVVMGVRPERVQQLRDEGYDILTFDLPDWPDDGYVNPMHRAGWDGVEQGGIRG
jgi:hypothetical protein